MKFFVIVHYEDEVNEKESKITVTKSENDLTEREQLIYKSLKQWRTEKASEFGLKNFMICHNSELLNISIQKPESINQLRKIKGFGEIKSDKYGDDIIALLNAI
jgi:ribonuclease D